MACWFYRCPENHFGHVRFFPRNSNQNYSQCCLVCQSSMAGWSMCHRDVEQLECRLLEYEEYSGSQCTYGYTRLYRIHSVPIYLRTFHGRLYALNRVEICLTEFQLIRPEKVRIPVAFANIFTTCVMIGITIRTCKEAGGVGPLIHKGTNYSTLSPAWAWFYAITSTVGGISSGILNQSDYTRFAKKQGHQVPGTIFGLFLVGTLVPILSILTASASVEIYGEEPFWNPLTLVIQWMLDDYSPGNRAGAFFCSLAFVISQLAENILGNGFAAGMDLAGLFPKYINMRRGCLLCAILSWIVQPWLFYNTASVFVAVMASFSVFLAPLTGIMLADYFIIRKQRIQLHQLYTGSEEGAYFYTGGVNWRAMVTWVVCFTPAIPGMIATLNPTVILGEEIMNYYRGNYIFGMPLNPLPFLSTSSKY